MKFVLIRSGNTGYSLGHRYLRIQTFSPKTLVRCVLAYCAGVFTGRTNVFAPESASVETQDRREERRKWGESTVTIFTLPNLPLS